ncbi:uncharacterized protein LOC100372802 [Saccoglossus kowalevskii]|uniref:Protein shisa-5-like n=1 Tax=Saccoglossus kowalevskii TaxID=10224 RepID=A0A0U2U2R5_SACKO|nr:PREDICTED: protein shisa-5-like [Saccoglossus kowalevskii]ALR88684.1 shisa protein-like 348 [Saccoglossus kowalevskii]
MSAAKMLGSSLCCLMLIYIGGAYGGSCDSYVDAWGTTQPAQECNTLTLTYCCNTGTTYYYCCDQASYDAQDWVDWGDDLEEAAGLATSIIIGIVCGVIGLIVLIIVCIVICCCCCVGAAASAGSKSATTTTVVQGNAVQPTPVYSEAPPPTYQQPPPAQPAYQQPPATETSPV